MRLAVLLVGSPEVAADLVQDCFVRLHPRGARSTILGPTCGAASSTRATRTIVGSVGSVASTSGPASRWSWALGSCPTPSPPSRTASGAALVLRFYSGLPDADIADALGCRPGTVASLVHRGLAALREVIEP